MIENSLVPSGATRIHLLIVLYSLLVLSDINNSDPRPAGVVVRSHGLCAPWLQEQFPIGPAGLQTYNG